jgi:hypothetical protein
MNINQQGPSVDGLFLLLHSLNEMVMGVLAEKNIEFMKRKQQKFWKLEVQEVEHMKKKWIFKLCIIGMLTLVIEVTH